MTKKVLWLLHFFRFGTFVRYFKKKAKKKQQNQKKLFERRFWISVRSNKNSIHKRKQQKIRNSSWTDKDLAKRHFSAFVPKKNTTYIYWEKTASDREPIKLNTQKFSILSQFGDFIFSLDNPHFSNRMVCVQCLILHFK